MTHPVVPRRCERRLPPRGPMYRFDFDLKVVAAIWLISTIILLPLLGLMIRLALVPLLEAMTRARKVELRGRRDATLAVRLAAVEARLDELTRRA